jgi:hypothetical protein
MQQLEKENGSTTAGKGKWKYDSRKRRIKRQLQEKENKKAAAVKVE